MKISFCTACWNRLNDLQISYLSNIENNISSKCQVEFVLLNYNSSDNMDIWAEEHLSDLIEKGVVSYYREVGCLEQQMSKSKNITHKLSTGDFICNLDADNFIAKGFADHLCDIFTITSDSLVKPYQSLPGIAGRIAISRKNFFMIGGYDERFVGWGFDDADFCMRAVANGLKVLRWSNTYDGGVINSLSPIQAKETWMNNMGLSTISIADGEIIANQGVQWGRATLIKNFREKIVT